MTPPIIIRDRVYIPTSLVDETLLDQYYLQYIYGEQRCSNCGQTPSINNVMCERCQQPDEVIRLWSHAKDKKGKEYYAVPNGHLERVQKVLDVDFSKYKIKDRRACPEMEHKIKWTGKLREGEKVEGKETPDQKKIAEQWLKKKKGIIKAPPRTGKSVICAYLVCKLGLRTLIIAHQRDLLENFLKTFKGSASKKAMTNTQEIEDKTGKPVVGIVENIEDVDKYDVVLITYQKFISHYGPKRIRKHLLDKFGLVFVDEVHMTGAHAYSKFINQLNPMYKGGLTATPNRKDNKSFIIRDIIGPITAESKSTAMVPIIKPWETGIRPKTLHKTWHGMLSFLQRDETHKNMIVKQVFRDLRAGHQCIIIPLDRKQHIFDIVRKINEQAKVNNEKRNENWQIPLAQPFYRETPRNELLRQVDDREIRVVVPIRSMMKMGIDMIEPSMLYNVVPTSNPAMYYQLINRVCTPLAGKQPVVRHMVDITPQSFNCFRSIFRNEIMPGLKGKRDGQKLYYMHDRDYKRAIQLLNSSFQRYSPSIAVNNELVASDADAGTTAKKKLSASQRIERRKEKRKERKERKKVQKDNSDKRKRQW